MPEAPGRSGVNVHSLHVFTIHGSGEKLDVSIYTAKHHKQSDPLGWHRSKRNLDTNGYSGLNGLKC